MQNLYTLLADVADRGERAALATVIRVTGSTPREVGAKMVIYADGHTVGTVGGGEMEARVIATGVKAIAEGVSRLVCYELRDTRAGDPGVCGGAAEVFIDVVAPSPTLLVVGAGHVAMPVAEIGHLCGFRVVVVDDREDMASEERFPYAARRIVGDIGGMLRDLTITPETYVVIVTRGHAYDEQALRAVIDSRAAYVGMIGSRRKVRTVYIGARTPAEIAVSIMAEIVMVRHGGSGAPIKVEL